MKNFKTKKIVLGTVMALSAVSLASVGFANWIINAITGVDSKNITADVGKLVDTSVTASIVEDTDLTLRFDNASQAELNASGNTIIFQNGDGDKNIQKLSCSLQYKIALSANATTDSVITVAPKMKIDFKLSADFLAAITGNYIAGPFTEQAVANNDKDNTDFPNMYSTTYSFHDNYRIEDTTNGVKTKFSEYSKTSKEVTATSTFVFKWGSLFGGHNPGYIKASEPSGVNADTIKTNLKNFTDNYKNSLKAKVTVTPLTA